MPQSLNLQTATPPSDPDVTIIHFYPSKNHDQEQTSLHGPKDDDDDLPDWTLDLPDTTHVRFFRERDWARSRLGALRGWNHTLKLFTRMVFVDSRAACLWW